MRTNRFICLCPLLVSGFLVFGDDANAQGLLQRLRGRIEAAIPAPPTESAEKNSLPARPLEDASKRDRRPDAAPQQNQPPARYRSPSADSGRLGSASRISTAPTLAPDAVEQASASNPADSGGKNAGPAQPSRFGNSILAPLDFDEPGNDASESPLAASIGITAVAANPGYPGVQITGFASYSNAARQGLRVGDYIFSIDGEATPNVPALIQHVGARQPGQKVRLRYGRAGQVRDLEITLVAKPATPPATPPLAQPAAASLPPLLASPRPVSSNPLDQRADPAATIEIGAELLDATGRRGVIVANVQPQSTASRAGLQAEDRIVSVEGKLVSDAAGLAQLLALRSLEKATGITVIRNNQLVNATLDFTANGQETQPASGKSEIAVAESDSPSATGSSDQAANSGEGSLVSGLGSVLGGMFSQKATSKVELAAPNKSAAGEVQQDPLALDSLELEPETLPPAKPSNPAIKPKADRALQAEIERLREQLKSLEQQIAD